MSQAVAELIHPTAIEAMTKAEVDIQIATAHRFPRVPTRSINEAISLACASPEVAEKMAYSLPRDGKDISGPSVRFAEIVAYSWGNIRAAARIIEVGETEVVAQGVCHDLEKNVATSTEVRRRITNKHGKRYSEDMIVVTGNAAAAIAFRNAVFKVIPPSLFHPVLEAAKKKAREMPLEKRIARIKGWLNYIKVEDARALAVVGKAAWDVVSEDDLDTFNGLREAISEGTTTIEEAFPGGDAKKAGFGIQGQEAGTLPLKKQPAPEVQVKAEEKIDTETGEVIKADAPELPPLDSYDPPAQKPAETKQEPPKAEKPASKYVTCPPNGRKAGKQMAIAACNEVCADILTCPALKGA